MHNSDSLDLNSGGRTEVLDHFFLTMSGDKYGVTWPEAEMIHASDDGQDFETESLQRLTTEHLLHGGSEPLTGNYSPGQHGSPDRTLVHSGVYQSCRDLTACESWDEIHSSTPNRKSKTTMHDTRPNNLSATSVDHSVTEYVPSCLSNKMVEQVLECSAGLVCVRPAETSFPGILTSFPTIESEIYPPEAPLTTPGQHLSTRSPFTYTLLAKLGQGVHGEVFVARLKDNLDNKFYTLKTISKDRLVQREVTGVTKELWILRLITDATMSNKPFPFLQKLKESFQDEKNVFIVLVNDPIYFDYIFLPQSFCPGIFPNDIGER